MSKSTTYILLLYLFMAAFLFNTNMLKTLYESKIFFEGHIWPNEVRQIQLSASSTGQCILFLPLSAYLCIILQSPGVFGLKTFKGWEKQK